MGGARLSGDMPEGVLHSQRRELLFPGKRNSALPQQKMSMAIKCRVVSIIVDLINRLGPFRRASSQEQSRYELRWRADDDPEATEKVRPSGTLRVRYMIESAKRAVIGVDNHPLAELTVRNSA